MNCPRCGSKIKSGEMFCSNCGTPISSTQKGYPAQGFGGAPKPTRGKGAWIAGIIAAVMALSSVISLILLMPKSINTNALAGDGADSASFSTEIPPGFTFDDTGVIEVTADAAASPVVSMLVPSAGPVGSRVTVGGTDLVTAGLRAVMLGEAELNILSVANGDVEAIVPFGAVSGNISLVYADQTLDAGHFDVQPLKSQLLGEQTLSPSADAQTVSAQGITVTIPGGALDAAQTVRIEHIEDMPHINMPASANGTTFSVSAGDMHEFGDVVTIDYPLGNMQGAPVAAYFNETTSLWNTLPSEVIDGNLRIYTDHLSLFGMFSFGKEITSKEGNFMILYSSVDKFSCPGVSSMDDFAQKVGVALEDARKKYAAKLPAQYCEDFTTFFGRQDPMVVLLDGSGGVGQAGEYDPIANFITLPTHFNSKLKFEAMAAHELFHAYQDVAMNAINMGWGKNKWVIEASAELAAYELVIADKKLEREIEFASSSQNPYYKSDGMQEYDMSCFLRYLLRKTNSKFEEMWVSVASNSKSSLDDCLNDFFKSKSADYYSLSLSYLDFWRDVVGNKDAPTQDQIGSQFDGKEVGFALNQHTAEISYTSKEAGTTAFGLFNATAFSANMPLRIFNVECIENNAKCTQISGIRAAGMLNTVRVSGGHDWRTVRAVSDVIDKQRLYTLRSGANDMVLVALEALRSDATYKVKVSEIQAQCLPLKLDGVIPGQQQKLQVAFKDIFSHVKEAELVIDFGDGTVKNFTKTNETGTFGGKITHTFGNITGKEVSFSMYDISGGGRELISKIVIPMTQGQGVTLSASPNPAAAGQPVTIRAKVAKKVKMTRAGDTNIYKWNFGNGDKKITTGVSLVTYTYQNEGAYKVSVVVLDQTGAGVGKAEMSVTVAAADVTSAPGLEPSEETSEPPEPIGGLNGLCDGRWQVIFENSQLIEDYYISYIYEFKSDGTWSRIGLLSTLDGKYTQPMPDEFYEEEDPDFVGDGVNPWIFMGGTYIYDENTGKGIAHIDAPNPDPDIPYDFELLYFEDPFEPGVEFLTADGVGYHKVE